MQLPTSFPTKLWSSKVRYSFKKAAIEVLKTSESPLSSKDITKKAIEKNICYHNEKLLKLLWQL